MKIAKILVLILLVSTILLAGCHGQDGGSETKAIGWDENGPYFLKHKTNGSQVAIGKGADAAHGRFNATAQKRNQQLFVEKLSEGKTPAVTDASGVVEIMSQFGI